MKVTSPQALLKGIQLFKQGQELHAAKALAAAAEAYRQAMRLMPDHPQLLINYGQLACDVSDWKSAEKIYRHLMSVANIPNVDGKLAEALFNLERYEEAIPPFEAFNARNPGDAVALRLLGTSCLRTMRFEDAIRHGRQSWQLLHHQDTISLLIAVYLELGDGEALAPLVEEALARFPDDWQVQKLAAEHLLKAGDYRRGFRYFSAMRVSGDGGRHYVEGLDLPWWDGKRFDGTLLVGAEQGIGDEIITSSMYADLAAMQQDAVIEVDPRLLTILGKAFPTLQFIARNQRSLKTLAERGGELRKTICGNLGEFFRAQPGWHAAPGGWLRADAAQAMQFRQDYAGRWPGRLLVGLSWKSQRTMKSGVSKNVSLSEFLPLLDTADTAFVNLQYGDVAPDIAALPDPSRIFVDPAVDTMHDMDRLFAQVAALDLVITTSNVTAHVAGALGKPCWVILPRTRPVIWYWGYRGDTTPWYPHARLFRSTHDEDWSALLTAVAGQLQQHLAAGAFGAGPAGRAENPSAP